MVTAALHPVVSDPLELCPAVMLVRQTPALGSRPSGCCSGVASHCLCRMANRFLAFSWDAQLLRSSTASICLWNTAQDEDPSNVAASLWRRWFLYYCCLYTSFGLLLASSESGTLHHVASRSHAVTYLPCRIISLVCHAVPPAAHCWTPLADYESAFNHCHEAFQRLSYVSVTLLFLRIHSVQSFMALFLHLSYFDRTPGCHGWHLYPISILLGWHPTYVTIPKLLVMLGSNFDLTSDISYNVYRYLEQLLPHCQ